MIVTAIMMAVVVVRVAMATMMVTMLTMGNDEHDGDDDDSHDGGAVCNDGTVGGLYIKVQLFDSSRITCLNLMFQPSASRKWVLFLQGGFACWDRPSCDERYRTSPNLMSSTGWPANMTTSGMLGPDSTFSDYNIVHVN